MKSKTINISSAPASEALDVVLAAKSNKRTKRSNTGSPHTSFSFDMSEIFAVSSASAPEVAFPDISFDVDSDAPDDESITLTCARTSRQGKHGRSTSRSGLNRSKINSMYLDMLAKWRHKIECWLWIFKLFTECGMLTPTSYVALDDLSPSCLWGHQVLVIVDRWYYHPAVLSFLFYCIYSSLERNPWTWLILNLLFGLNLIVMRILHIWYFIFAPLSTVQD